MGIAKNKSTYIEMHGELKPQNISFSLAVWGKMTWKNIPRKMKINPQNKYSLGAWGKMTWKKNIRRKMKINPQKKNKNANHRSGTAAMHEFSETKVLSTIGTDLVYFTVFNLRNTQLHFLNWTLGNNKLTIF